MQQETKNQRNFENGRETKCLDNFPISRKSRKCLPFGHQYFELWYFENIRILIELIDSTKKTLGYWWSRNFLIFKEPRGFPLKKLKRKLAKNCQVTLFITVHTGRNGLECNNEWSA